MKYKNRELPFFGYKPNDNRIAEFIKRDKEGWFEYRLIIIISPIKAGFMSLDRMLVTRTEMGSKWKELSEIPDEHRKSFIESVFNYKN